MTWVSFDPGAFDSASQQWRAFSPEDAESSNQTISTLKIATFNVWFEDYLFEERGDALLSLLEEHDADIIALQEVTPLLLGKIMRTGWIREQYAISDMYGGSVDPYGVLLLTRFPVQRWSLHRLPSAMGRHLLTADVVVNGEITTFATVHLESLRFSAPTRAKQLRMIFPLLDPAQHVFLMGDFNFCSSWTDENNQIDLAYHDIWAELRPDEPGYTIDTDINQMRLEQAKKYKSTRFDRMLLRSKQPGWIAETIELLGTEPIDSPYANVFPSDHFGLLGVFEWRKSEE